MSHFYYWRYRWQPKIGVLHQEWRDKSSAFNPTLSLPYRQSVVRYSIEGYVKSLSRRGTAWIQNSLLSFLPVASFTNEAKAYISRKGSWLAEGCWLGNFTSDETGRTRSFGFKRPKGDGLTTHRSQRAWYYGLESYATITLIRAKDTIDIVPLGSGMPSVVWPQNQARS